MKLYNDYVLAEPWWLLLLLLVPLLAFLAHKLGTRSYLNFPTLRVLGTLGWKPKERTFRFGPVILPLLLIPAIIGLARPQEQKTRTSRTASGIDILIALDASLSMNTPDFADPNRRMAGLERRINAAKKIILEFIKRRPDDRIGIVSFAARPYTVAPVTLDHEILSLTLRDVALVENETESGTAIGSAIVAAGQRLEELEREDAKDNDALEKNKSKIIVLITDGKSNSGQLSPVDASKLVADLGIKTYTIAIGTPQGRLANRDQQEFDPDTLKQVAEITKGEFYHAKSYAGLREAFTSIDQLEKTEVKRNTWLTKKELYPWFVAPSIILLLLFLGYQAINPPPMP